MSEEVSMPALGESVTEGTVTQWLKQVGDTVEVDEPLLEVSTDKVDTEIPSPVAGTVQEIRVQEDETVEVGTVLAVVGSGEAAPAASEEPAQQAEEAPAPAPAEEAPAQEPAPAAQAAPTAAAQETPAPRDPAPAQEAPAAQAAQAPEQPAAQPVSGGASGYVTPLVRKMAKENDIDLDGIKGTGVGGRIRKQDVQAAIDEKAEAAKAAAAAPAAKTTARTPAAPSPLRGTTEKMSRRRK